MTGGRKIPTDEEKRQSRRVMEIQVEKDEVCPSADICFHSLLGFELVPNIFFRLPYL